MIDIKPDLYPDAEFCMTFSTEEIQTEYMEKLKEFVNGCFQVDYDGPKGTIDYISFEIGEIEFAVRFYGFETALYINDTKFMLVDDRQKAKYTLDHTYGNVVYGGVLRSMTHQEILDLLLTLTTCFIGCNELSVQEMDPRSGVCEHVYRVIAFTPGAEMKPVTFENIMIEFISNT